VKYRSFKARQLTARCLSSLGEGQGGTPPIFVFPLRFLNMPLLYNLGKIPFFGVSLKTRKTNKIPSLDFENEFFLLNFHESATLRRVF